MLLVVESDKADMDVEAYEEGYLAAILTDEGETAAVGAPVSRELLLWQGSASAGLEVFSTFGNWFSSDSMRCDLKRFARMPRAETS